MTDQSSVSDNNDLLRSEAALTSSLTSPLDFVLKKRFSAEARVAQNLVLLLAALGIALGAGLITLKNEKAAGFEFAVGSTKAGIVLLAVTSVFFLIRFLFLAWRDWQAYGLKMLAALRSMHEVAKLIDEQVTTVGDDLGRRQSELNSRSGAFIRRYPKGAGNTAIRQSGFSALAAERAKLKDEESKILESLKSADGLLRRLMSLSEFIDKYTIAFEISLPCVLVAVLISLIIGVGLGWVSLPP
jgi:hypothetical protein